MPSVLSPADRSQRTVGCEASRYHFGRHARASVVTKTPVDTALLSRETFVSLPSSGPSRMIRATTQRTTAYPTLPRPIERRVGPDTESSAAEANRAKPVVASADGRGTGMTASMTLAVAVALLVLALPSAVLGDDGAVLVVGNNTDRPIRQLGHPPDHPADVATVARTTATDHGARNGRQTPSMPVTASALPSAPGVFRRICGQNGGLVVPRQTHSVRGCLPAPAAWG